MSSALDAAAVLCMMLGMAFTIVALRGRRISTVPRCRLCDYQFPDHIPHCCPECGALFQAAGSVATSGRKRSSTLAVLAITATLLSGIWFAARRVSCARQPTALLVVGALFSHEPDRVRELTARIDSGSSIAAPPPLVSAALTHAGTTADPQLIWSDFAYAALRRGLLSRADAQALINQTAPTIELSTKGHIVDGQLSVRVALDSATGAYYDAKRQGATVLATLKVQVDGRPEGRTIALPFDTNAPTGPWRVPSNAVLVVTEGPALFPGIKVELTATVTIAVVDPNSPHPLTATRAVTKSVVTSLSQGPS